MTASELINAIQEWKEECARLREENETVSEAKDWGELHKENSRLQKRVGELEGAIKFFTEEWSREKANQDGVMLGVERLFDTLTPAKPEGIPSKKSPNGSPCAFREVLGFFRWTNKILTPTPSGSPARVASMRKLRQS